MSLHQPRNQYELLKTAIGPDVRRDKIVNMLRTRRRVSRRFLYEAFADPASSAPERTKAERSHGLIGMALEPLERAHVVTHNPLVPASFMRFVRADLAAYILREPSDRSVLRQTVFFGTNEEQRKFARSLSAAVRPLDYYDDMALAAGVAFESVGLAETS